MIEEIIKLAIDKNEQKLKNWKVQRVADLLKRKERLVKELDDVDEMIHSVDDFKLTDIYDECKVECCEDICETNC